MTFVQKPSTWVGLLVLVGLSYAGWVFYDSLATHSPHQQVLVDQPGLPPHYVELWTDPEVPVRGSATRLVLRINYHFLRGGRTQNLSVELVKEGGTGRLTPELSFTNEERGRGEIYAGRVRFPSPGRWTMHVRTVMQGRAHRTRFSLTVQPAS